MSYTDFDQMMLLNDPHDQLLIANCHPPQHVNPQPSGKYNLIAIGAGAAGLVSAGGAGSLGAKSALIERVLTGGDCLNTGCVPSKGVIRAARAAYETRHAAEFGIHLNAEPQINFAAAMERMRRLRARISHVDSVARIRDKYNVDIYLGDAKFINESTLEVAGQKLEFNRCVIATGGRAAELSLPGLAAVGYHTNETIFTLTELPRRLAVIGAGPIGCELAQSFQRFGSAVTMLTDSAQIMPREDADAAAIVQRQFVREGVTMIFNARLLRAEQHGVGGADKVLIYERDGQPHELACDLILAATGRVPNIEGLNLAAASVRYDRTGVLVDERLRTSNSRIYAAGDVCSKFKFTHAADAQARLVIRNALFFGRGKASSLVMPWATYTDPEIAHVGFYEAEARAAGYDVATLTEPFADVDRAILDGDDEGFARIHYDRRNGKILGGTIVSSHAGEIISELTLAMTHGLKLGALSSTIHPYPTQADVLRKLGDAYNRTRLTPTARKLFGKWFAWWR